MSSHLLPVDLDALFTVVIGLDADLHITTLSPVLTRYAPEIRAGDHLTSAFEVVRPRSDGDVLGIKLDMIHLMISRQSRYPVRAQLVPHGGENGTAYVLLGAPWLSQLSEDQLHGYTLKDFPVHDAQLDWLFMLSAERQQVRELRQLSDELLAAKSAADAANVVKTRFFAVMSHEMRTPLNAVIGTLSLLRDELEDAHHKELIALGDEAAHHLLETINDVLDFSKLEADKLPLELSVFNLRDLVSNTEAINRARANTKGLHLVSHVDSDVSPWLQGDDGKIKQVLLNLVGNAIKFTPAGQVRVTVSCVQRSGTTERLRFAVSDTGVGVAEEFRRNLFNEFWTHPAVAAGTETGTGLGLDICRRMVALMEGVIDYDSEVNRGSTFWFELPLMRATPNPSSTPAQVHSYEELRERMAGHRVLLAEDNQANQAVGKLMLERMGLRVDLAANGLEAVQAVKDRHYDVVLMDIGMPELDGFGATDIIRRDLKRNDLVIIACTAYSLPGDREKALARGCNDYIAKPLERNTLGATLARWLETLPPARPLTAPERLTAPDTRASGDVPLSLAKIEQMQHDIGAEGTQRVLGLMADELTQGAPKLATCAATGAFQAGSEQAHALKGTAMALGAERLAQALQDVETQARANDPRWLERVPDVLEETDRLRIALDALL